MNSLINYITEKLKLDKNISKQKQSDTDKLDELAIEIVKEYFGGYLPSTLDDEGMKCNTKEELYKLIENLENYWCDNHPKASYPQEDVNYLHSKITEIVKRLNN